ncbi:glycoside hydrolase [Aspergillus sclerotioniger CBS 115572]|uniref:non-reducing end alpha-L-arabinofuranosidase n=1 Tax=Aspergillus sclerotioniger CBS 115572 TaxID=1450535 RepID=A0A317VCV9_9EURO|nr:glycoside hydrolase [Aspergillus sclerotioniger CBS 115572]PWY70828.1 glycoside hydrolase [Aspergillus sclerotioniger CBS 115572]
MKGLVKWLYVAMTTYLHQLVPNNYDRPDLVTKDNSATGKGPPPILLNVQRSGGNQSSPLLYGIMFEVDLADWPGDGGMHGQLLQNNGFQGDNPGLTAYKAIGDVDLMQDMRNPVSSAITSSLQVSLQPGAKGFVGFANTGYDGVPVMNATYSCEFWMMGDYSGTIMLELAGSSNGKIYASHNMTVWSSWEKFTKHQTSFNSTASPDGDNEWRLLFNASQMSGTLNFGLVQLFPPTYKSRANGLRNDVATFLEKIHPSFLRFPGGNNLEGLQIDSRWQWNLTIGPVVDRPGRESDWFYPNTDALGLDEYLWWCEDMHMEPVLAVWDGKSYGGIVSQDDLEPYIDDILNELEYILGPSNSTYGSLRAKHGRTDPWPLQYIEIGNEDDYTGGCDTYPDRFMQIHHAIQTNYPSLSLIASNLDFLCLPIDPPSGLLYDYHYYRKPEDLVSMFNFWDNHPRSQPVIIGEYGCRDTGPAEGDGPYWSSMQCACSEAVHMIGLERNSDVVRMAAYAPLLQHFGFTQWSPTLFGLDSTPNSLTPSLSYYVQRMFSTNRGNTILPVNTTTASHPLYWVASKTNKTYFIKLANYSPENHTVHIHVSHTESGHVEVLSGQQNATNLPHNITIQPRVKNITSSKGNYTVDMEPWGVVVVSVS